MTVDWLREAGAIAPEFIELRHAIHRDPEPGNREFHTAERVERYLHTCGIETRRLAETAVLGLLRGAYPGRCAALRADMDALPVREESGVPFASENPGFMHACGHDVHTAAALGAARLLSERRGELRGSVVFLFQPDEEGDGGAERMIRAGALEGVDAVFGCHVSPELPAGHVGVRFGKFYAAADLMDLTLRGKSAHGAERERGADALAAASELVGALLALPSERPEERTVVSVGTFHAGTVRNIVADAAELGGIIRSLGPDNRAWINRRVRETAERVPAKYGVTAELRLRQGYPGVVNDDAMTELALGTARALLGPARVHVLDKPTMTTEDFGYFLQERPGCFYHIGAGCSAPLHSAAFVPADETVPAAAAFHAALVWRFLEEERKGGSSASRSSPG